MSLRTNFSEAALNKEKQEDSSRSPNAKSVLSLGGSVSLSRGEAIMLGALTVISLIVRLWRIDRPSSVVFDEVHFGGFANKYILSHFFMDVHPPLAKLLFTLVAYAAGFHGGQFDFRDIGKEYGPDHVPYVAMRTFPAVMGVATVIIAYLTLRALQLRPATALVGSLFLLFENALVTQSRLILLDSFLVFFVALSFFFFIVFDNENSYKRDRRGQRGPFSRPWWTSLFLTGLSLGAVVSCKWVGLFVIATVGLCVVQQLWTLLGDLRVSMSLVIKHFVARAVCLIAVPLFFYMFMFQIHLWVLTQSGDGDGFMSSEFQHTLRGHGMEDTYRDVYLGATITIRHVNTHGGYLHSHPHTYPAGSKQQQVTLYPHRDANNDWVILNATELVLPDGSNVTDNFHPVTDRMVVKLFHPSTKKNLHSHDIRAPVTDVEYQNEVSAYGFEGFEGDANDYFYVELENAHSLQALRTQFRLRHYITGCYLFSHRVKLPDWGFEQQEVTCNKNPTKANSLWYVETNTHERYGDRDVRVNYRRPSFLSRFIELQKVMWKTNAGLTDRHAYDSRPRDWPFLRRGINFWVKDNRQIYLIGNIFVWYLGTLSVLLYATVRAIVLVRSQRGFTDLRAYARLRSYDRVASVLFLGWALHYAPFFLMGRQLFLHHYLPSLYFAVLLAAATVDAATATLRPRSRLYVLAALVAVAVYVFWTFSPLAYAGQWTRAQCERHKWRKHWDFSCDSFPNSLSAYGNTTTEAAPAIIDIEQYYKEKYPDKKGAGGNENKGTSAAQEILPGRNEFGAAEKKAQNSEGLDIQAREDVDGRTHAGAGEQVDDAAARVERDRDRAGRGVGETADEKKDAVQSEDSGEISAGSDAGSPLDLLNDDLVEEGIVDNDDELVVRQETLESVPDLDVHVKPMAEETEVIVPLIVEDDEDDGQGDDTQLPVRQIDKKNDEDAKLERLKGQIENVQVADESEGEASQPVDAGAAGKVDAEARLAETSEDVLTQHAVPEDVLGAIRIVEADEFGDEPGARPAAAELGDGQAEEVGHAGVDADTNAGIELQAEPNVAFERKVDFEGSSEPEEYANADDDEEAPEIIEDVPKVLQEPRDEPHNFGGKRREKKPVREGNVI